MINDFKSIEDIQAYLGSDLFKKQFDFVTMPFEYEVRPTDHDTGTYRVMEITLDFDYGNHEEGAVLTFYYAVDRILTHEPKNYWIQNIRVDVVTGHNAKTKDVIIDRFDKLDHLVEDEILRLVLFLANQAEQLHLKDVKMVPKILDPSRRAEKIDELNAELRMTRTFKKAWTGG